MGKSDKTKLTFKRFEKKYILTKEQYDTFMEEASSHLIPDAFHESLVLSIYYDSDNYDSIRHSIEKPVFKQKLRVRSYGVPKDDGTVFVELKKKYKGIVYKRRVATTNCQAKLWLSGEAEMPKDTQTAREIDWFLKHNKVSPKAFIGAHRVSWMDKDDNELRITFDKSIKWRLDELNLSQGADGEELLKNGRILMEIKIPMAAPMWLAELLSSEKIFPTSYSKYGTCYVNEILDGRFRHAQ